MLCSSLRRAAVLPVLPALQRPLFNRSARIAGVRYRSNIHDRYAEKLRLKAKERGVELEELLEQAKPEAEKVRLADVADLRKQSEEFKKRAKAEELKAANDPKAAAGAAGANATGAGAVPKSKPLTMELDSFVDVEKFRKHSAEEIQMLWKARFLNTPNAFSGSMSADAFSKLYINARKNPTFVLPLPHKAHGIELHYVQWSFVTSETVYCLITSLAQYKLHGEYAHPHTTFMLHTDLAADKQVVLTNSVIQDNEVATENAALLVLNLQRFYTADDSNEHGKLKKELLRQFNSGDASFSVDKLIQATETLD